LRGLSSLARSPRHAAYRRSTRNRLTAAGGDDVQGEGQSLLLRVRKEIPDGVQPEKYPKAIEMHWKYAPDSPGDAGCEVAAQITSSKATIDPIQGDHLGYVMMIVMGAGERTWLWYVADPKAFVPR